MPYDSLAPPTTTTAPRSRLRVMRDTRAGIARQQPDEMASHRADDVLTVEPMLLVYQERLETFRLIAAAVRRGLRALTS